MTALEILVGVLAVLVIVAIALVLRQSAQLHAARPVDEDPHHRPVAAPFDLGKDDFHPRRRSHLFCEGVDPGFEPTGLRFELGHD